MVNDNAIVYMSKIVKAEIIIKNIGLLGIDVSQFNDQLKQIKSKHNAEIEVVKKMELEVAKKMNIESAYISAQKEIDNFIISLSHYEKYFITMSKCSCISDIIETDEIDLNKLNLMVADMIDCLEIIRESETVEYDEEQQAIEQLYQTVYELIKYEIKVADSSKLLSYCQGNEIDCVFLSKLILLDIDKIDPSKINVLSIKKRINEINSLKNNNSMYLDEELLKIIYSCENKKEILEKFKIKIDEMSKNYKKYIKQINQQQEAYQYKNNYLVQFEGFMREDKKKLKKDILKSIASFTIFSTVLATLVSGTWKMSKSLFTEKDCLTDITTYSTISDNVTKENSEYIELKSQNRSVYLTKYYPWEKQRNEYSRDIVTYDLSDIDLVNLKDYSKLDLDKLGRNGSKTSENKEQLNLDDLYDNEFVVVTKLEQDQDNFTLKLDVFASIMMTGLLTLLISLIGEYVFPRGCGVIKSIFYLKDSLETTSYYDHKKKYLVSKKEVDEVLKKIEELTDGKLKIEVELNNLYNDQRYKEITMENEEKIDVIDNGGTLSLKKVSCN